MLDDFVRVMKGQSSSSTASLPPNMNMDDVIRAIERMNESIRCNVCFTDRKDTFLLPCHHELCKKCVKEITTKRDGKCPVCRERIVGSRKKYN